ncbi:MAG: energy transducer TonB [Saprospiraceae bacterium]
MAAKPTKPNPQQDSTFQHMLRRWFRGDMTLRDEASWQSMAREDGFQRDALDGYRSAPEMDHEAAMKRMQEALHKRVPPKPKVFPINRVLSIAAVFLLLVAAIYWLPQSGMNLNSKSKELAQNTEQQDTDGAPSETMTPAVADKIQSEQEKAVVNKPTVIKDAKPDILPGGGIAANTPEPPVRVLESSSPTNSNILSEDADDIYKDEAYGYTPVNNPPLKEEAAGSQAFEPAVAQQNTSPQGTSRKARSFPIEEQITEQEKPTTTYKPKMDNGLLGGQPAMGWDAFDEYLRRSALLPIEARNNNVTGVVRLEFSIDPGGSAFNFVVLQGLGYGCDEEAIRLVSAKEWLRGSGGRTRVDVWFRR